MRLETQTHTWNTRGPGLLTEARGYCMYMHSASQFGSLGPGSPGPGSTEYNVPAYSCFGLVGAVCCDIVQCTCNITMATPWYCFVHDVDAHLIACRQINVCPG